MGAVDSNSYNMRSAGWGQSQRTSCVRGLCHAAMARPSELGEFFSGIESRITLQNSPDRPRSAKGKGGQ